MSRLIEQHRRWHKILAANLVFRKREKWAGRMVWRDGLGRFIKGR